LVKTSFIGRTTCFGPTAGPSCHKEYLKGNYVGGNITVRVIMQQYLVVTYVAEISKVMAIKLSNLMFN
jgi:hypothetical protein